MKKRKDNLTDLLERLPKVETSDKPKPSTIQQVVGSGGEVITLTNKNKHKREIKIYGKSFELGDIEKLVQEAVRNEMQGITGKIIKRLQEKLKEEGLI